MPDPHIVHPLLERLKTRSLDLYNQAKEIIDRAKPLLDSTRSTFPTGTDHTSQHTTTVEQIAQLLLSDDFLNSLNEYELFFLAASCHYHDLGMSGTELDDQTESSRSHARRIHAIRIGERIACDWAQLGFNNQRIAAILGEICRGHRPQRDSQGIPNWDELSSEGVITAGTFVRVRLLSALIFAIDELHIGADRAPERLQSWKQITNEESKRHWLRHLAIHGPALLTDDNLCYQICIPTPAFEEKLRTQVLQKALSSIDHLQNQAKQNGIESKVRKITIDWSRLECYKLILSTICSDLTPRTRSQLCDEITSYFQNETTNQLDLSNWCTERSSNIDQRRDILRTIDDAIQHNDLINTKEDVEGDRFILSTRPENIKRIIDITTTADSLDRLFLGRYCKSWKAKILNSDLYRFHINQNILPSINRDYSVQLRPQSSDDALLIVLQHAPSATRLATLDPPHPSNLSKGILLKKLAIAGAIFDLFEDPTRLLDAGFRKALHSLTEDDVSLQPTLRLFEDLALLDGITKSINQDSKMIDSDCNKTSVDNNEHADGTIQISVSHNTGGPTSKIFNLQRLMLASRRSGTPIEVGDAPDHAMSINIMTDETSPLLLSEDTSKLLIINPIDRDLSGAGFIPSRLVIDIENQTIQFRTTQFTDERHLSYPLNLRLPPPTKENSQKITPTISIRWPSVSVGDLLSIHAAQKLLDQTPVNLEVIRDDKNELLVSTTSDPPLKLFKLLLWDDRAVSALEGLDKSLPLPLFLIRGQVEEVLSLNSHIDRQRWWQNIIDTPSEELRTYYSVYLRITSETGRIIEDSFLQFIHDNPFTPPTLEEGASLTQDELDSKWNTGSEDFKIQAFFDVELMDGVSSLIAWMKNPASDFPFKFEFDNEVRSISQDRTVISVVLNKIINKTWYMERPLVFEFRPINRYEAYDLEAKYWRSVQDYPRQLLAEEIRDRCGSEVSSDDKESTDSDADNI